MKSPVQFFRPSQFISRSHRQRYGKLWLLPLLALLVSPQMQTSAHAFAGEDPLLGRPWHHEELTELATVEGKFSHTPSSEKAYKDKTPAERDDNPTPEQFQAAEAVGWNADYVDSYLYSPIWWAQGGFDRFKISLATAPDLERVHFDDLFDSNQVRFMWRRYTTGAVAGLLWAKDHKAADGTQGDVAAAQNILGVSLHAMQDFYSHSNWIDDPARRDKTLFEVPIAQRPSLSLYTGAYEHDENLGVKSHGKFIYAAAVWNQPGIKQLMEVACGPGSPIGNDELCRDFHESQGAIPVTPNVGGVKLPSNVLFVHPGINVDNLWSAEIGVKERGLTDITGQQALDTALTLAQRQSVQWLTTIDKAMTLAGPEAAQFWGRVKNEHPSEAERLAQFENFSKFPFQFFSAGPYPPQVNNDPEYYLRLKVKTGDSTFAGTDADIRLKVDGWDGDPFLLDYTPGKNFVLAHNDFEKSSETVYSVGPFKTLPKSVTFFNDSATNWDVLKAAGKKYLESIIAPIKTIGSILTTISGKDADWIQTNHQVWMPDQLAAMTSTPETFHIPLDGGDRGHYEVSGTIAKTGEDGDGLHIKIHLHKLFCIKESKWDRGSNSDEPFLLAVPMSLPGESKPYRTEPYDDVDTGENREINADFEFTVPRDYGMVNLPLSLMEHDDESRKTRDELLDTFAGKIKDDDEERSFLNTIGSAAAADWQLGHLEVTAWTRNGPVNVGIVHDSDINQWVKGRKEYTVAFNNLDGLKSYPITPDDLMPYFPPGSSQPQEPTTPTDPGTPTGPTTPTDPTTPPIPSPAQLALMDNFAGKWRTPWGVLTLVRDGSTMKGVYHRSNPVTHIEGDAETVILGSSREARSIEGQVKFGTMSMGTLFLTLDADNDTFTGNFQHNGDNEHPGQRIKDTPTTPTETDTTPTVPTVPTVPTTPLPPVPTVPTTPTGPVPTVPTTPTPPTTPATGGSFRPLGGWSVQIDSMRVARGGDVEVTASYKNVSRLRAGLTASDVSMVLTDSDGVGLRNNGNLYRAGGDPDMEPEKMGRDPQVEPGGVIRLLSLFTLPRSETPLKTLTIFGYRCKPLTFDVSGLTLPEPVAGVQLPINGAVGASNGFSDFDDYNVRFDGVRKGRGDTLQLFVSVKNMSKDAFKTHPGTDLDLSILDQDGIAIPDNGTIYRASGDGLDPERIDHTIILVPNGTATVCYTITVPKGAQPRQLLIKYYNDRKLLVTLPAIP